jgi:hypothetical protein
MGQVLMSSLPPCRELSFQIPDGPKISEQGSLSHSTFSVLKFEERFTLAVQTNYRYIFCSKVTKV